LNKINFYFQCKYFWITSIGHMMPSVYTSILLSLQLCKSIYTHIHSLSLSLSFFLSLSLFFLSLSLSFFSLSLSLSLLLMGFYYHPRWEVFRVSILWGRPSFPTSFSFGCSEREIVIYSANELIFCKMHWFFFFRQTNQKKIQFRFHLKHVLYKFVAIIS
jgi:hypothetical protein